MIRRFPAEALSALPGPAMDGLTEGIHFPNPFRYSPHPLIEVAAELVIREIGADPETAEAFSEGKMLGVLVVEDKDGDIGYLAAFSGNVAGKSMLPGFVPPIFDLTDSEGRFKKGEAVLNSLTEKIRILEDNPELHLLRQKLSETESNMGKALSEMKATMALAKRERDEVRCELRVESTMTRLIRESQHQKAELRRIKERGKAAMSEIKEKITALTDEISLVRKERAEKSDQLQKWIFEQYIVTDGRGEQKSIGSIFAEAGLVPPGGTGECAAPKLLEYARRHALKPLTMGEFWYGRSPESAVRTHSHFYPSCTSKCGPLLSFMLAGTPTAPQQEETYIRDTPEIVYEDNDMIVAEKPAGMPSVPGLDGRKPLSEWISENRGDCIPVHRLDMDTSGIIIFAKNLQAAACLQRQFEEHTVLKTYKARLSPDDSTTFAADTRRLKTGEKGEISLPLSPDHDERPRQKADSKQGKSAYTEYEVTSVNTDGTIDIIFHPHTGRTHQLRVHAAHTLGLRHPILGDMLYGGAPAGRLHLHAYSITFRHPGTKEMLTFTSDSKIYRQ